MTAVLPEVDWAPAEDATDAADGPGLYADGWSARLIPTGPVPQHALYCAFASYGFPAETCACTAGTNWLRQHNTDRRHP